MKGESTRRPVAPSSACLSSLAFPNLPRLLSSCLCLLLRSLCLDSPLLCSSRLVLPACLAKDKAALWFKCKESTERERRKLKSRGSRGGRVSACPFDLTLALLAANSNSPFYFSALQKFTLG